MPKIADVYIRYKGTDAGAEFFYKANASVTTDGIFSVKLHTDLEEIARTVAKDRGLKDENEKPLPHVTLEWTHGSCFVRAKQLEDCSRFIRYCAKDFLACETVVERVIVYGHDVKAHFWKDGKNIYPNGARPGGGERRGNWFNQEQMCHVSTEYYSVGFGAAVFDKKSYKRKTGETVSYEIVREDTGTVIDLLNSFSRLEIDPETNGFQQMPYSDEAAQYFYEVMLNICRLADQIHSFFGNRKAVEKAIETGSKLLLKG